MKLKLLIATAIGVVLVAAVVLYSVGRRGYAIREVNRGLWKACNVANSAAAAFWLAKGADPNVRDVYGVEGLRGQTPLNMCAHLGNTELVEMLLMLGADPNAADDEGLTSLHNATDARVADKLVRYGADLQKKDKEGLTALQRRQKNSYYLDDELKATLEGNGPASKLLRDRQVLMEKLEKERESKEAPTTKP